MAWKLLHRFAIIGSDGTPYLVRYTILGTPWFAIRLHHFLRSDEDPCLHDHPWPFVTCILHGGYYEETSLGAIWHPAGCILVRPADWSHRVVLRDGVQPWTLIVTGRECRDWGFWTKIGWQHWRVFISLKSEGYNQCESS